AAPLVQPSALGHRQARFPHRQSGRQAGADHAAGQSGGMPHGRGRSMTRWFEEIVTGEPVSPASHSSTAEEIMRFAERYDPQYFHLDPELARHSHFGGLVASGWHTVSVGHRKMVDALSAEEERLRALGQEPGVSGPSPGVNAMEFKAPVRPGDTVSYELTVTGKRKSNSL